MQVIVTVVFIAYYIIMAFKQREPCMADASSAKKDGGDNKQDNISTVFAVSFIAGFILHTINFTVSTFLEPCVRLVTLLPLAQKDQAAEESKYSMTYLIGYSSDLLFRFGFIAFSVGQLALLGSAGVSKCAEEVKELGGDAHWMRNLATA